MRVAAVQLTSTADRERNLATADRLTRAAAAAGAELVVLPEKWPVLGTPEETAAGRRAVRRPGAQLGARDRPRAGHRPRRRLDRRARARPRDAARNTSVHVGPDGEVRAIYRKIHMFDVEVGGRVYRESEHEAPGDEIVLSETADGVELGPDHLLRPALPRAVPDPRRPRRARDHRAGRVHARHDARPLGGAAARPRDRGPGVRDRRQPGRRARAGLPLRRALDDRRPVGRRARARRRTARRSSPPSSTSTARPRSAARCPRSPTAGREAYALAAGGARVVATPARAPSTSGA